MIDMRYVIALLLPWLAFFTMGKVFQGVLCLLLQVTLIGWLPAVIWAFYAIYKYDTRNVSESALPH